MTDEEQKRQAIETEQKQIDAGKRVKEFLNDPAVQEILKRLEKGYIAAIPTADTDEKRRNVWASINALTAFVDALNGTLGSAELAQHVRTTRLTAEDRAAARTPRK